MRQLTEKELLLVSGGSDTGTLDTVIVNPPDFPDPPDPPDPTDPWDGGGGGGDNGGGGGDPGGAYEVPDDEWTYYQKGEFTGDKVIGSNYATYAPLGLTMWMSQSYSLADGSWDSKLSGTFSWNSNTYNISATATDFVFSGASASYSHDFGAGISLQFSIDYNAGNNEYVANVRFVVPYP